MHIIEAEKLLIRRRRLGITQSEAAGLVGVPYRRYVEWERGERDIPAKHIPRLGKLKPWEQCLILRERHGMSQAEVAQALGRSRIWVGMMERGEVDCGELINYLRLA